MRLKTTFCEFLGMYELNFPRLSIFHQLWAHIGYFRAKKDIDFSPPFNHYFTIRLTSESYNYPLKVLTEGSMVEYLPVGSQEAPQTIFGKKFPALCAM